MLPRILLALAVALALLAPPTAGALGAHVGDKGAFVAEGTLELWINGSHTGHCEVAVAIASETDGGWRITAALTTVPVAQYCTSWCCGQVGWFPGATDAQGSPEVGFHGSGRTLGLLNVVTVGPLGAATPFELVASSDATPEETTTLRGTLDFTPWA